MITHLMPDHHDSIVSSLDGYVVFLRPCNTTEKACNEKLRNLGHECHPDLFATTEVVKIMLSFVAVV